ncbi:MAG: tetratricopeptide repeat protein [Vulcanimicrobiota bacterium]
MNSLGQKVHKSIRVLRIIEEQKGLSVQHDYGALFVLWDDITHIFGARMKKGEYVPCLAFFIRKVDSLFIIEGSSFNYKDFLKNEYTHRRETNFFQMVKKFSTQANLAYIDWSMRDSLKGGLSLLPAFSDINKLIIHCQEGRSKAVEQKVEKVEIPSEDSLAAVFSRRYDIFSLRRKEALRHFSRAQGFLARIHRELSEPDDSEQAVEALLDQAINELDRSKGKDPWLIQSYIALGEIYMEAAEYRQALECFINAVEINPFFEGRREVAFHVYCKGLAAAYQSLDKPDACRWPLHQYLGFFLKGKEASYCVDLLSNLDGSPIEWFNHYSGGMDFLDNKSYSLALEHFNRAISLYPDFRWSYHWKGKVFQLSGRHKEALDSYALANKCCYDAMTDLEISMILRSEGHIDDSIDILNRIIKLLPRFHVPYLELGKILFYDKKDETECFNRLLKVIEIKPDTDVRSETERIVLEISEGQKKRRGKLDGIREEWNPGDLIGKRYKVQEVIKGGMGIVYIVDDMEQGRVYAMKSFQEQFLWDSRIIKMFIKEAEVWVKLGMHKNIVQAEQVRNFDGKPYIFLEYVEGTDLEHLLKDGPLDIKVAAEFALQFCEGMNYAYNRMGIIHRDIKPSNCLLTRDGVLKITDFGLAKIFTEDGGERLASHERSRERSRKAGDSDDPVTSGGGAGTFPYMSPEQFVNQDSISTCSDIYSFGAMLFEMLIGAPPFGSEDFDVCINGHLYEPPPDPCKLDGRIPDELGDIILKCLEKEPSNRFRDFGELLIALNDFYEKNFGERFAFASTTDEASLEEIINRGESLVALGRFSEALGLFNEGLKVDEKSVRILVNKGECLYKLGNSQEALVFFDLALSNDPDRAEIWYQKGNVFSSMKLFEDAMKCYDRALQCDSELAEVWSRKGVIYDLMGHLKEALKCNDRAIGINPRLSDAWNNKGNLLSKMDRAKEAVECYRKAIEINPRYMMAWYNRGILLQKLNMHNDAIEAFDKVTELNNQFANAWVGRGMSFFKLNNMEKSLESFKNALEIEPHNFKLWILKGNCLYEIGRLEESATCYGRALKINKTNVQAWISRGVVMGELLYLDQAMDCYDKALELNPSNDFVIKALLRLKRRKKKISLSPQDPLGIHFEEPHRIEAFKVRFDNYETAINHYSHLQGIFTNDPVVLFRKGVLLSIIGKDSEAMQCFEGAERLDPIYESPRLKDEKAQYSNIEREKSATRKEGGIISRLVGKDKPAGKEKLSPSQWHDEGVKCYGKGDYLQATRCFEHCIKYQPDNVECWYYAALSLLKAEYHQKAFECITKGLARLPLDHEMWLLKGNILDKLGRVSDALDAYLTALKIAPYEFRGWMEAILCLENVSQYSRAKEYAVKAMYFLDKEYERGARDLQLYKSKGILSAILERYEVAKKYYSEILKVAPRDSEVWNLTGDCHYRLGQWDDALSCFARVAQEERDNSKMNLRKSLCYYELGSSESALKILTETIKTSAEFEWAWYFKGILLSEMNDREGGMQFFNEALEAMGHSSLFWESRGVFFYNQSQVVDALWCFDKAIELNRWDINLWLNRGMVQNKLKKPKDAVYCFNRILEMDSENVRVWYFKALSLFLLKDWEASIECCNKAIEINPRIVDAWVLKGVSLYRTGVHAESLLCFDRGLELDPEQAYIWNNRGVLLREMESLEEAINCYNKTLEVDPRTAIAWFNKGRWLSELKRLEEAIECFDRVLDIDSRSAPAWLDKGNCHYELNRYAEALRSYEMSIRLDAAEWEAWYNRGLTLLRLERPEESISAFDKAVEINPGEIDISIAKGLALMRLNRGKLALDIFRACQKRDPENEVSLYNMALTLKKLNYTREADEAIRKLLDINPDFSFSDKTENGRYPYMSPIRRNYGVHLMMEFKIDYPLYIKKPPHYFMA